MKILLIPSVLLGFTMVCCSQELSERDVPSLLLNTFNTRFSDARDIDWEKKGHQYEVEFERGTGDDDHKLLFDAKGTIVMYKHDIKPDSLPAPILNAIQANYKDHHIDEAEMLEVGGTTYYQVELEKPLKKQQLVFTANGIVKPNITYWD